MKKASAEKVPPARYRKLKAMSEKAEKKAE